MSYYGLNKELAIIEQELSVYMRLEHITLKEKNSLYKKIVKLIKNYKLYQNDQIEHVNRIYDKVLRSNIFTSKEIGNMKKIYKISKNFANSKNLKDTSKLNMRELKDELKNEFKDELNDVKTFNHKNHQNNTIKEDGYLSC